MEDYLDEDDEAIKMIKSGEFTSTFDQFMENIEKEIKNVEIEENELLDVENYHIGNLEFMTESSRKEELEEGKMIAIGAVINHEYPEGNIIIDYNNYKDPRMNIYIPGLSTKNEDSSLFDEDHYFWGMENVMNLSHDEMINNLNSLIDNLGQWLAPTPTQNTDMVETLMDTETDDANDDESKNTTQETEINPEHYYMGKELTINIPVVENVPDNDNGDDPNDDEINIGEIMDMEWTETDTETDDPNDDESKNTTQETEINPEHYYMGKELPINIPVVENVPDNDNGDDPNGDQLNIGEIMDMERTETDTETDDANDDESKNTTQETEINPEHYYMCKELPINIPVVENVPDNDNGDDPNDDQLNIGEIMDMERTEMDTETDDPNDDESKNTTQETEINPEHYYMCKELPINILVVENVPGNDNGDDPNDDQLNIGEIMDMERTETDTETDDPNDDESKNTTQETEINPEHYYMGKELTINIPVVENVPDNDNGDDPNDDQLNIGEIMDMERTEMDTETDDPNDDESKNTTQETEINPEHYYMCKELPINILVVENVPGNDNGDDPNDDQLNIGEIMDMERTETDTETDDPNDDESKNTTQETEINPEHYYMGKKLTINIPVVENVPDNDNGDDPNDDPLNIGEIMDMERTEMDTETDDPNDDESKNTTQETEINPEHYYMCKELPVNIPVVENVPDNDNGDRHGTAANHHIDANRRQKKRGNIFRRFWSYIRKRTKRN